MNKNVKYFNFKLYGVITFFAVAALLAVICVSTFQSRYTAFHPTELVKTYVDTIVQSGDGYNAYKNTLASKSQKYGDFIRTYYINPVVYRDTDYSIGDDTDDYKGYNDESYKGEKTLNDNGTLSGLLIEKMYPIYENLVNTYVWDNYDSIYTEYIKELIKAREEVFGDKFFNDEVFFTTFEANVVSYGKMLTGTEDIFDENTGVQLSQKSIGIYEKIFGEDYKFVVKTNGEIPVDLSEYKSNADKDLLSAYGVDVDEISEVKKVNVSLHTQDEKGVSSNFYASADVTVVKIDSSWYVDNTCTDTSEFYSFYK